MRVYAIWGVPFDNSQRDIPDSAPIASTQLRTNQQGHFDYVFNIVSDNYLVKIIMLTVSRKLIVFKDRLG